MKRLFTVLTIITFGLLMFLLPAFAGTPEVVLTDEVVSSGRLDLILEIVLLVVTIGGGIIATLLTKGKLAVDGLIKSKIQNEGLQTAIGVVNDIAWGVAQEVYDEHVRWLKQSKAADSPGGKKLTKGEVEEVKKLALDKMKLAVPQKVITVLEENGVVVPDLLTQAVTSMSQIKKAAAREGAAKN